MHHAWCVVVLGQDPTCGAEFISCAKKRERAHTREAHSTRAHSKQSQKQHRTLGGAWVGVCVGARAGSWFGV